jgi:predicted enzyme related to lactoylglutathione lyase
MTAHGGFHWNELNTHDVQLAREFYGKALGWSFDVMPMPGFDYYIAKSGHNAVGGIFEMKGPEFEGMPSHWLAYIAVDDVDARIAEAAKLGAKIRRGPWDIAEVGRVAIVQDPTGAIAGWITPA